MIFAIGTAIFLVAMMKAERGEGRLPGGVA